MHDYEGETVFDLVCDEYDAAAEALRVHYVSNTYVEDNASVRARPESVGAVVVDQQRKPSVHHPVEQQRTTTECVKARQGSHSPKLSTCQQHQQHQDKRSGQQQHNAGRAWKPASGMPVQEPEVQLHQFQIRHPKDKCSVSSDE